MDQKLLKGLDGIDSIRGLFQHLWHETFFNFHPLTNISLTLDIFLSNQVGARLFRINQLAMGFGMLMLYFSVLRKLFISLWVPIIATLLVALHPMTTNLLDLAQNRNSLIAHLMTLSFLNFIIKKQINLKKIAYSASIYLILGLISLTSLLKENSFHQVGASFKGITEFYASNTLLMLQGLGQIFWPMNPQFLPYLQNYSFTSLGMLGFLFFVLFLMDPELLNQSFRKYRFVFLFSCFMPLLVLIISPSKDQFVDVNFEPALLLLAPFFVGALIKSINHFRPLRYPILVCTASVLLALGFRSFLFCDKLSRPSEALRMSGNRFGNKDFYIQALILGLHSEPERSQEHDEDLAALIRIDPSEKSIPYLTGKVILSKNISADSKMRLFESYNYCTPLWSTQKAQAYIQMKKWVEALRAYETVLNHPENCLKNDDVENQWENWVGNFICLSRLAKSRSWPIKRIQTFFELHKLPLNLLKAKEKAEVTCKSEGYSDEID
jgi:hypothetical protein